MNSPDFVTLARLEENALAARLTAARATLSHAGEKGRALEQSVTDVLRHMLPTEYGLSTGFVAFRNGGAIALSPQLDIIICDAVRTGPLARLGACDVFPLEAVYGYVEVKAALRSVSDRSRELAENSIERCLETNQVIRRMQDRQFHSIVSDTGATREPGTDISIRSYLIAFSAEGTIASDPEAFAQRMANVTARLGDPTHFHGVYILGTGLFKTRPVPRKTPAAKKWYVDFITENCLSVFKASLVHDLARFPRFRSDQTPALEDYFADSTWQSRAPQPEFIVQVPEA